MNLNHLLSKYDEIAKIEGFFNYKFDSKNQKRKHRKRINSSNQNQSTAPNQENNPPRNKYSSLYLEEDEEENNIGKTKYLSTEYRKTKNNFKSSRYGKLRIPTEYISSILNDKNNADNHITPFLEIDSYRSQQFYKDMKRLNNTKVMEEIADYGSNNNKNIFTHKIRPCEMVKKENKNELMSKNDLINAINKTFNKSFLYTANTLPLVFLGTSYQDSKQSMDHKSNTEFIKRKLREEKAETNTEKIVPYFKSNCKKTTNNNAVFNEHLIIEKYKVVEVNRLYPKPSDYYQISRPYIPNLRGKLNEFHKNRKKSPYKPDRLVYKPLNKDNFKIKNQNFNI